MVKLAIVEDEVHYVETLKGYLSRYEEEKGTRFDVTVFSDGDGIVTGYTGEYDIILMDIQMKFMDGMSAAEEIRKLDSEVIIIFITNMTNYAIRGYEVDALDYILKPVEYFSFSQKLEKAVGRIKSDNKDHISLLTRDGIQKINLSEIMYIDSDANNLNYHLAKQTHTTRSTIKQVEERLTENKEFYRINKGIIVNMDYVDSVRDGGCIVAGEYLAIARARRKAFTDAFLDHMGRQ